MKKTDDNLKEDADIFEMLGEYGAWAVVAGVVAEIWYAVQFHQGKSFFEAWGTPIASGLIAFGVIVEIICARKVRSASEELDRRSNERVAQLQFDAFVAMKQAEDAGKDAANARRETARLMAAVSGRRISPENMALLAEKLGEFTAGTMITYVRGDPESEQFAAYIHLAFKNAGWKVKIRSRMPKGAATGLWVLSNATPSERTSRAHSTVGEAFKAAGLAFELHGGPVMSEIGDQWGPNTAPVHVIVGSKDPADFP